MALSDMVMAFDEATLRQAIDELANALQAATLVSTRVQAAVATANDDAVVLQQTLKRAHITLERLQPRSS